MLGEGSLQDKETLLKEKHKPTQCREATVIISAICSLIVRMEILVGKKKKKGKGKTQLIAHG